MRDCTSEMAHRGWGQFWRILLKLRSYYQEENVHNMTSMGINTNRNTISQQVLWKGTQFESKQG